MPSKYFAIDTSSTNWCGVHVLSILLYTDQFHYSRYPGYQSSLNDNILWPLRHPVGLIVDNSDAAHRDALRESIAQRIRDNFRESQDINTDEAMARQDTTDIINTLTEINMFFATHQNPHGPLEAISADDLKNNLSPLVYKLYWQMTKLVLCEDPTRQDQLPFPSGNLAMNLRILEAVIGNSQVATDFFHNVNRDEMVTYGDGVRHYRRDLSERLDLMEISNERIEHDNLLVVGDVTALREPIDPDQLYQFSTEMMENMTRLFCSSTQRPQVNAHNALFMHDFDLWGSDDPFVIKGENGHFKLLIKANGPHVTAESLEQMAPANAAPPPPPPGSNNGNHPGAGPSGGDDGTPPGNNNYPHNGFNLAPNHTFFESWYSFFMMILAALAVIAGIYLMFRKEAEPNSPQNNTRANNNRQRRATNGANQQTNPANDAELDNSLEEPVHPVSFDRKNPSQKQRRPGISTPPVPINNNPSVNQKSQKPKTTRSKRVRTQERKH